jgi:hypothetical protein
VWTQLLALQAYPGRVLRIGLGAGEIGTVIEDTGMFPDGVAVVDGVVYWTTMGAPETNPAKSGEAAQLFTRRNGTLRGQAPVDGRRRELVASDVVTTGKQLAHDGAGTLYWADREGRRIGRVRTNGTGLAELVVRPADEGVMGECVGVAVDRARGHLYWTQKGPAKGGAGRIFRAGLEIPPGQSAAHRTDVEELWSGLPEPVDLHLDGDWLYWTDRGAPPAGNTLNRAPLPAAGRRGAAPEILADGFEEAVGLAVDGEAGLAYVSDLGGHIRIVPLPGGPDDGPRDLVKLEFPLTGLCGLEGLGIPADDGTAGGSGGSRAPGRSGQSGSSGSSGPRG